MHWSRQYKASLEEEESEKAKGKSNVWQSMSRHSECTLCRRWQTHRQCISISISITRSGALCSTALGVILSTAVSIGALAPSAALNSTFTFHSAASSEFTTTSHTVHTLCASRRTSNSLGATDSRSKRRAFEYCQLMC